MMERLVKVRFTEESRSRGFRVAFSSLGTGAWTENPMEFLVSEQVVEMLVAAQIPFENLGFTT